MVRSRHAEATGFNSNIYLVLLNCFPLSKKLDVRSASDGAPKSFLRGGLFDFHAKDVGRPNMLERKMTSFLSGVKLTFGSSL